MYYLIAILKGASLGETSAKKVRQQLETKFGTDLQSRKKEIDNVIMELVSNKGDKKKKGKKNDSEEDEEGSEDEEEEEEEVCQTTLNKYSCVTSYINCTLGR